jgi:hypothetical protein
VRLPLTGKKSDPGDAAVLADVLRTNRHQHRPMPVITDAALVVKPCPPTPGGNLGDASDNESAASVLLEFHPQAVKAFPNLKHHAALTILADAPVPHPRIH